MHIESQYQMFEISLGLKKPWKIDKIEMVPSKEKNCGFEVHINISYDRGSKFKCPTCKKKVNLHDTNERTWRHLNFFQYKAFVHAKVPRVKCEEHGVKTIEVPWARKGSGFTLLMEGVLLTMMREMPVSKVAKEVREHDTRLWRVLHHYVETELEKQDFSDVYSLGVDEYSVRGHNYITVFLKHGDNSNPSRVLFVTEGKDKGTVTAFIEEFKKKQGDVEAVKTTTSDMCHGFRNAMEDAFPNAINTVDKFHVVKMVQDTLDRIRQREMRSKDAKKYNALSKTRYLWLKNQDNLRDDQFDKLQSLLEIDYLDTVVAYNFKVKLQEFYDTQKDYETAAYEFEQLTIELANTRVYELKRLAKSLTRNAVNILNYFITNKTNAVLEGFNSKISLIKRRARGFKNIKNFMIMIYFVCGGIKLNTPTIM